VFWYLVPFVNDVYATLHK